MTRRQKMTLPPLPHLIAWTIGALGVAALVRLIAKEHRRVNDDLERVRDAVTDKNERAGHPILKRDPCSGIYRPQQRD
jgi:hypothetical protein